MPAEAFMISGYVIDAIYLKFIPKDWYSSAVEWLKPPDAPEYYDLQNEFIIGLLGVVVLVMVVNLILFFALKKTKCTKLQ